MKLLLDQNLSHQLVVRLADIYPDSEHVRNIGMKNADDVMLWDYAKQHGFVLVTKDEDFHARSLLFGHPPKVLWVRGGNCSTELVETLLRKNLSEILKFDLNANAGFLTLY